MTISAADNTPRVSYTVASGVTQTSFTVSFEFFADADINVYVDGVLKTITADYTVSGGSGATGTVAMSVTGASGGSTVTLTRSISLERTSDFPTSGPFNITALNDELDRMIAISADYDDNTGRALILKDSDASVSMELPLKAARLGTVLAFDETTGSPAVGPTIADTQSVANASADIATLADIEDGTVATNTIQTAASISSNISTVAGISANVTTVAGNTTNINQVASDTAVINAASGNATAAASSASAASTSESNAASSETAVAADKVTVAADKATVAADKATVAADKALVAADLVATNQDTIDTAADAATATTKAATATTQASSASTSASSASTSASNASSSETSASSSATAASASKDAALAALDSFDDRYLGQKTSDPTLDNDGNALIAGALYFNSTDDVMKVYEGAAWVAAYASLSGALLQVNNLSDLANATAARTNLGLGSLAVAATVDGNDWSGADLDIAKSSASAARDNLGLGSTDNVTFAGFTSTGIDDNATSTAITIDASENVGIGTSSFDGNWAPKLQVSNAASDGSQGILVESYKPTITLKDISGGSPERKHIWADNNTLNLGSGDASQDADLTIDSSGNVLVGTTTTDSTTGRIHVVSNTNTLGIKNTGAVSGATTTAVAFLNAASSYIGAIYMANGSSTTYATSSDYRLKEDVQPMAGASERVLALNPVNFAWKSDGSRVDGFLAHEAQAVVPEAVTGTKDAMRDEEYEVTPVVLGDDGEVVTEAVMGTRSVPDMQGIDQGKLVPLLTAALQDALIRITTLEAANGTT